MDFKVLTIECYKVLVEFTLFEEFKENYYLAREMGFENINIDIMFGLPDVSKEDAKGG